TRAACDVSSFLISRPGLDGAFMMKRMTHRLVFVLAVRRLHHAPTFSSGRAETLWSKVTVAPEKSWMAWMSGLTVIPRGAFRCSASSRMKGPAASFRWLSWSTTLFRKLARMAATQSFLFPAHHSSRVTTHASSASAYGMAIRPRLSDHQRRFHSPDAGQPTPQFDISID